MSTVIARKTERTAPEGEDTLASPTAAEREFLRGIEATTEEMERAGMFDRSPERRALYGDDPMREIDDLESGRHPLLGRARFALR
jgi:hypothetical protein